MEAVCLGMVLGLPGEVLLGDSNAPVFAGCCGFTVAVGGEGQVDLFD